MPLKGGGGIRWDRGKASHLKEREIINWLQHPPCFKSVLYETVIIPAAGLCPHGKSTWIFWGFTMIDNLQPDKLSTFHCFQLQLLNLGCCRFLPTTHIKMTFLSHCWVFCASTSHAKMHFCQFQFLQFSLCPDLHLSRVTQQSAGVAATDTKSVGGSVTTVLHIALG